MIRISVEVGRGAAHYRVAVQAESIERALEIVGRQNPGCGSWKRVLVEDRRLFCPYVVTRSKHTSFAPSF